MASKTLARNVASSNSQMISSSHVLINFERTQRDMNPLRRSVSLDRLARQHAQRMSQSLEVFPSACSKKVLQKRFQSDDVGENVCRGYSVRELHFSVMRNESNICVQNILLESFTEFGVGTSKGRDGMIYLVQMFRGSEKKDQPRGAFGPKEK